MTFEKCRGCTQKYYSAELDFKAQFHELNITIKRIMEFLEKSFPNQHKCGQCLPKVINDKHKINVRLLKMQKRFVKELVDLKQTNICKIAAKNYKQTKVVLKKQIPTLTAPTIIKGEPISDTEDKQTKINIAASPTPKKNETITGHQSTGVIIKTEIKSERIDYDSDLEIINTGDNARNQKLPITIHNPTILTPKPIQPIACKSVRYRYSVTNSTTNGFGVNQMAYCDMCSLTFIGSAELLIHLKNKHQILTKKREYVKPNVYPHVENPYKCGYCLQTFPRISELRRHQLLHSQISDVSSSMNSVFR